MIARDTDSFVNAHKFIRKHLLEYCSDSEMMKVLLNADEHLENTPCVFYRPDPGVRHIPDVPGMGCGAVKIIVSVYRAAWAVAKSNRRDHMGRHEEALHTCGQNGESGTGKDGCINPHHICKGTQDDRVRAQHARAALRKTFKVASKNEALCHA